MSTDLSPAAAVALIALHEAACRVADAGLAVAVVAVGADGQGEAQFIDAGPHRMKLLGALDVVKADIVADTPRDESTA